MKSLSSEPGAHKLPSAAAWDSKALVLETIPVQHTCPEDAVKQDTRVGKRTKRRGFSVSAWQGSGTHKSGAAAPKSGLVTQLLKCNGSSSVLRSSGLDSAHAPVLVNCYVTTYAALRPHNPFQPHRGRFTPSPKVF